MSPSVLGALFVCASALWTGYEKSRAEEKKLQILKGLADFCRYIGEEIRAYRTPLSKIYESFENDALREAGFIAALREKGFSFAAELLFGIVDGETQKELSHFAAALGGGDREGQSTLCAITLERLERARDASRESLSQRIRMYRLLPLLLGASVIILLL